MEDYSLEQIKILSKLTGQLEAILTDAGRTDSEKVAAALAALNVSYSHLGWSPTAEVSE